MGVKVAVAAGVWVGVRVEVAVSVFVGVNAGVCVGASRVAADGLEGCPAPQADETTRHRENANN